MNKQLTPDQFANYQPAADLLADRVILVTGADDGLGKAAAKTYAQHGATVVLLSKSIKQLEAVYDEIEAAGGPQPAIYPMDLAGATPKDYNDLAQTLQSQLGRLDGLLNNAGWQGNFMPFKIYDLEMYQRAMSINLNAPFLLTQACLPLLEAAPDPAILFSSHECSRAYCGAFGIAKAGLHAMMKILTDEYSGEITMRINSIDTGPVDTAMRHLNFPGEEQQTHPNPEDMMAPYLYLMGPDGGSIRGENVCMQPGKV